MLTTMVAASLILQTPSLAAQTSTEEKASTKISKVFEHYASGKSISGTVTLTQTAMTAKISVVSKLAMKRPGWIYLNQVRNSSEPRTVLLVSDGSSFAYDTPEDVIQQKRLLEKVTGVEGDATYEAFHAFQATTVDRSPIIDIAIAARPLLEDLTATFVSIKNGPKANVGGDECDVIEGSWRANKLSAATGTYKIYITKDYSIKRYVVSQAMSFNSGKGKVQEFNVNSTWDSTLKLDQPIDPKIFIIR